MTDLRGRVKPKVFKPEGGRWMIIVTRGYEGNYEHEYRYALTWREAFDYAYSSVKDWRP